MAGYKAHITASLLACGLLYLFPFWAALEWFEKVACILIAVFFGLWPDVDIKSKGQTLFLGLFLVVNIILIVREEYKRAAYLGLLVVLPVIARHRGWTHHWITMLLLPGGLYLAALHYTRAEPYDLVPYLLAALFGYASHLILDRVW